MRWLQVLLMILVGAVVEVIAFRILRHSPLRLTEPASQAIAMWAMLCSWWIFLRKLPINKNVHVGFYIAASLVVATCAVVIIYYL